MGLELLPESVGVVVAVPGSSASVLIGVLVMVGVLGGVGWGMAVVCVIVTSSEVEGGGM